MVRNCYTQEEDESFIKRVANLFLCKFPQIPIFSTNGTLDRDSFLFAYYDIYKTTKGVLTTRQDIKRMQDAMYSHFKRRFKEKIERMIIDQIKPQIAIQQVYKEAQQYFVPYLLREALKRWKTEFIDSYKENKPYTTGMTFEEACQYLENKNLVLKLQSLIEQNEVQQ